MPKPRVGDKVWVETFKPQPNGSIHYILYDDEGLVEEVIVIHLDDDKTVQYYEGSLFADHKWTDKFGGTWMIET